MKWIFRIFLILVVLIIAAVFGIKMYLEKYFDRDIIVRAVEQNTNSRFGLSDVNIGIFSYTPSLTLENIRMGKRDKYADEKVHIDDRPEMEDPLLTVSSVEMKADLIPLFNKKFVLEKFVVIEPKIKMSIGKDGSNDMSTLFKTSGRQEPVQEDPAVEETVKGSDEPAKESVPERSAPGEEFSAKDIPIAAQMNRMGVENGSVELFIIPTKQWFRLTGFDMVVTSIDIDPQKLNEHNSAAVEFNADISITDKDNKEQAKLSLVSDAVVRPLDPASGKIAPEALYNISLKKGSFVTGLMALEKLKKDLAKIEKLGLDLSIISKKAVLSKDAETAVRYKEGVVSFEQDLKILTEDYDMFLEKESWFNVISNQHNFRGYLLISKNESDKVMEQIDKFIDDSMKDVKIKGVKIDKNEIKKELLAGMVEDGRIKIGFETKGDISDPDVKLSVMPGSLTQIIKKRAGDIVDQKVEELKDKAQEEIDKAKAEAEKKIDEEKKKAEEKAKSEAEKLLEENKDKIDIKGLGF